MNVSEEDLMWIEQFYADFKSGMNSCGREWEIPADYIERAVRVIYGQRKPMRGDENE